MNPRVSEVDLVISTLGIMRKLSNTQIYKLDQVRHVILDEADTLLDVTFKEELCDILSKVKVRELFILQIFIVFYLFYTDVYI